MSRNKRWTLLQDIDGCLANFNSAFMDLLVDVNGPPKAPLKLECWHWPQQECGYTQEQVDKAWDEVDDAWWKALDPLPGAIKALDRIWWLEKEGLITPYFVTGRLPWARKASCDWLEEHGALRYPQVICTSNKSLIAAALGDKVAAVEDKPSIIGKYRSVSTKVDKLYVVDYPYNRDGIQMIDAAYLTPITRVIDTFEALVDLEKVILENEKAPTEVEAV
jgi:hypothetical protein